MSARLLCLLLLASLAALTGCAGKPVVSAETIPWTTEQAAGLTRFVVRGKVGFRRGETGGSAALVWQQDGERYKLAANGPLGQGATRISGNAQTVRIENGSGVRESQNPEALLAEAIGWPVSINSLAWWVRGVAAPGGQGAQIAVDAEGRPVRIRQQDWDVVLDRWQPDAGGRQMPHRVIASGGDSRVTLLIERWEFAPSAPARSSPTLAPVQTGIPAPLPDAAPPAAESAGP